MGVPPNYPFLDGIFHEKKNPAIGVAILGNIHTCIIKRP